MSVIDPQHVAQILEECANKYVLPRYKQLQEHEIAAKSGPRDLVTQADIDVEAHLERVLPDLLPGSIVIGEEGISRGDMDIGILQDPSQTVWIVDPVDGTHNFVSGRREFGIMLACVIEGETRHSWIYDILGDAHYIAEKGEGAYRNGEKLEITEHRAPAEMTAHINYRYFPRDIQEQIRGAMSAFGESYSLSCAAHEYSRIATGQSDLALYSRLKPWDHLPGALLVQEAGGYVAKWDERAYTPRDDYAGLIVASCEESWRKAFNIIFQGIDIKKYL
ncbi:MAG: inositol monophosphatase [Alphaproteobacteria bacterium]|nr:inositol monophosphatase [Alphaproteobacteria bacterium]